MKKALCFVFDQKYLKQGKLALDSAKKYNPDHTTILLTDIVDEKLADIQINIKDTNINLENWLLVARVAVVELALESLGFDTAIFVDGDTYSYNSYDELQEEAEKHSVVVIPHITSPLPVDEFFPQNLTIAIAGNYNTGVWAASKEGLNFIKWWRSATAMFPITRPDLGLVAEQGWLRFVNDFEDNAKVFRHPGYNVAYWNIKHRVVEKRNDIWHIDDKKLAIIHFSGLKKDIDPSKMSVFQNRFTLDDQDPVYELYKKYHDLVWK
jgi:hypothetical protein